MSFLEAELDLSETIFSQTDLEIARQYLVILITEVDPKWLVNPVGYLSRFWLRADLYSVCFLIYFANTLNKLEREGLSSASLPVFYTKVAHLLRKLRDKTAFEEAFTELEVAAHLARTVTPILLEPRILELEKAKLPRLQPISGSKVIDLALPLKNQVLFVEVTVFHYEAFYEWQANVAKLAKLIHRILWLENLTRTVQLELPFPFSTYINLDNPIIAELINAIVANPTGELNQIRWLDYPDTVETLYQYAGISCVLSPTSKIEFEDNLIKSFRNSMRVKRVQCRDDLSPLLVIKPGSRYLSTNKMLEIIERRMWNNRRFAWVSGMAIFTPQTDFRKKGQSSSLVLSLNPRARQPLNRAVIPF